MRNQLVQILHKLTILKNIIKKSIIGENAIIQGNLPGIIVSNSFIMLFC